MWYVKFVQQFLCCAKSPFEVTDKTLNVYVCVCPGIVAALKTN